MEVVIADTADEVASIGAAAIARTITDNPNAVLGLATGSSPLPLYQELIARCDAGEITFDAVTAFLLDEYVGLPEAHPEAYEAFIRRKFTDHIDLRPDKLNGPDGRATDLASAGPDYETKIAQAGGIDLQILGIGGDGHIGFNEPSSSLGSRTRIKTLTDETREDNARFFDGNVEEVPRHVLTQGIGTILDARHLLLVATGQAKAAPIAATVEGPLTAMVPASVLQLHPHATVIVDPPAAAELKHGSYYRETYDHKPDWQGI